MGVERTDDSETGGTDRTGSTAEGPEMKAAAPAPEAVAAEAVTAETAAPETPDPKIAAAVAAAEAAGPQNGGAVRTDSWIWSVRLVKTRSAGATACRGGHVRVNGERVKPAHSLRVGDEVRVREEGRERIVVVKRLIRKRVGAPVAAECYVDNSPPPPPREAFAPAGVRDRGAGRPTKRDRRELERLRGLAEGDRRNRFTGPGGPSGSGAPDDPEGANAPDGPSDTRRSDRSGNSSDRGGNSRRAGSPSRAGNPRRARRSS
ncbi:RNA-binding S4 domain-containing protein [Streptomyces sp. NPDC005374]|uniref:RNA-binding S4 domain-containing protein n=1 Tax=Streptomyces sp. NPDC005374 TaxID=3364713 RepID=UPI0036738609